MGSNKGEATGTGDTTVSDSTELTSQDIEHRINGWKMNIDSIKKHYYNEAAHMSDVETRLEQAQRKLYNWAANVKLMQEKQKLLEKELDFINERQNELNEEVEKIDVPSDASTDIANTVDEIEEKLASLNVEISKRSTEEVTDPKIVIAKILNSQLSSLDILSQRIVQMRQDLNGIDYLEQDGNIRSLFEH